MHNYVATIAQYIWGNKYQTPRRSIEQGYCYFELQGHEPKNGHLKTVSFVSNLFSLFSFIKTAHIGNILTF